MVCAARCEGNYFRNLNSGAPIGDAFKADIVVAHELILEIKAVTTILPLREVQLRIGQRWPGLTRLFA